MTLKEGMAFGLVVLTIAAFVWGRFRYDVVALTALVVGLAIGVVPPKSAFDGFNDDVTIIIACALVVSAAFARSGIVEWALQGVLPHLKSERSQAPVLTVCSTLLSMCTKNVGALAIMLPVAQQLARRTGSAPSRLLMPMSFGAMIGGLVTLVGTSPNILVSEVRERLTGKPFAMYDFSPVGLTITALAIVFLAFGYRLLPRNRQGRVAMSEALAQNAYLTEAKVPEDWAGGPLRVGELIGKTEGEIVVMALLRGRRRLKSPSPRTAIQPGDTLLMHGEQQVLDDLIGRARLTLTRSDRPVVKEEHTEEVLSVEAVIGADSILIGQSAQAAQLHAEHGFNLLGVSRAGYRPLQHLRSVRLKAGDVLLLRGGERKLPGELQALGLLPLAERTVSLGGARHKFMPAIVLAAAMVLVAFKVIPVAIAFFGAAVIIVLLRGLRMREAYGALDGPLLVLIAALIPVSNAIQATGGADLVASKLALVMHDAPGVLAVGALLFVSMAVTPFLNNAATVLIVAPIGASLAKRLGYNADPFLMAVAVGAASDFLTPIGHQCNTLVMAPGGYRFGDYARLGAPLSVLILLVGPPLILAFWPLH